MIYFKKNVLIISCIFFILLFSIPAYSIDNTTVTQSGDMLSIDGNQKQYKPAVGKFRDIKEISDKMEEYKTVITFISGLATITMVAIFMKHFIKLAVLGTEHWAVKRNCIIGLLWSGIATVLLGSATTVFAISYNLFK